MSELLQKLDELEPIHREALLWFWRRQGQEIPWTPTLDEKVYLMNRHKGIHKPAGWRYVLSVRESLSGPYEDHEPVRRADGSWSYRYAQEGSDPTRRDNDFTNRGLLECARDGVPIAVLRQTEPNPRSRYLVLGLAQVGAWEDGYFILEGYSPRGELGFPAEAGATPMGEHAPMSLEDARMRIEATIVQRQGAGAFRANVLSAFGSRCAITDCDAVEALEAAHIVPYRGAQTDAVENGLLLRADLHTLFDRLLLQIDPMTLKVSLAPALRSSSYAPLHGKPLRLPKGVAPAALCRLLTSRAQLLAQSGAAEIAGAAG